MRKLFVLALASAFVVSVFFHDLVHLHWFLRILGIVLPVILLLYIWIISGGEKALASRNDVLEVLSENTGWMSFHQLYDAIRQKRYSIAVAAGREQRPLVLYGWKYSPSMASIFLALEYFEKLGAIISREKSLTPWELQARNGMRALEWRVRSEEDSMSAT